MAGVKGRSGGRRREAGRPRLAVETLQIRGTFRKARHGGLATSNRGALALAVAAPPVTAGAPPHLSPATARWGTKTPRPRGISNRTI